MKRLLLLLSIALLPVHSSAQAPERPPAPASTTFYSVSSIEVKPSSRTLAIATLKQYREITHRDDLNIRLELFEQADRSGHILMVETWKTAASFDAKAAARKQLADSLEAMRISGWDTRPYKTLTVASGSAEARWDRVR